MEPVPMSQAKIAISVDSLLSLPPRASYRHHSGQATADIAILGDTVYVTATCDSLQRLADYYEAEYTDLLELFEKFRNAVKTEDEQRSSPVKVGAISLIVGFISGAIFIIILIKN